MLAHYQETGLKHINGIPRAVALLRIGRKPVCWLDTLSTCDVRVSPYHKSGKVDSEDMKEALKECHRPLESEGSVEKALNAVMADAPIHAEKTPSIGVHPHYLSMVGTETCLVAAKGAAFPALRPMDGQGTRNQFAARMKSAVGGYAITQNPIKQWEWLQNWIKAYPRHIPRSNWVSQRCEMPPNLPYPPVNMVTTDQSEIDEYLVELANFFSTHWLMEESAGLGEAALYSKLKRSIHGWQHYSIDYLTGYIEEEPAGTLEDAVEFVMATRSEHSLKKLGASDLYIAVNPLTRNRVEHGNGG